MLQEYFRAVYDDFSAKIEVMSQLVRSHPGEHGRLNELIIGQLLREYLPKQYSLGSGFVIDSEGGMSRQCDIVIYDQNKSPRLFQRTGPVLFPVEAVYAVIEVKTTLDVAQIADACDHISSVRSLKSKGDSTLAWERQSGEWALVEHKAGLPLGIIIGYQSSFIRLDKIKEHFVDGFRKCGDPNLQPDLAVSIKEGFTIRHRDLQHTAESLESMYFPLRLRDTEGRFVFDGSGNPQLVLPQITMNRPEEMYIGEFEGYRYNHSYKVCAMPNGYILADAPTLLLAFLGALDRILSMKHVCRPPFGEYVANQFSTGFLI